MAGQGKRRGPRGGASGPFGLGMPSLALLATAAVVITVGYVLLDRGSVTAAPLLLALGYVVLIPAALLVGGSDRG